MEENEIKNIKKEVKEIYEKRSAFDNRCLEILKVTACNYYIYDKYYYGKYKESCICINKRNGKWEVYICNENRLLEKKIFDNCFDACKEVIYRCSYNKQMYTEAIEYFISILDYKYKKKYMYEKENKSLTKKLIKFIHKKYL